MMNKLSPSSIHDYVFDSLESALEHCKESFELHASNDFPLTIREIKFWEDYLKLLNQLTITNQLQIKYERVICVFEELKNL